MTYTYPELAATEANYLHFCESNNVDTLECWLLGESFTLFVHNNICRTCYCEYGDKEDVRYVNPSADKLSEILARMREHDIPAICPRSDVLLALLQRAGVRLIPNLDMEVEKILSL